MRAVGVLLASFILASFIFGIQTKVHAASSGVVVATVQIKQPVQNTANSQDAPTVGEFVFASLALAPQAFASIGPIPTLPVKIKLSIKTKNSVFGYA